jgi:hypothetical protein
MPLLAAKASYRLYHTFDATAFGLEGTIEFLAYASTGVTGGVLRGLAGVLEGFDVLAGVAGGEDEVVGLDATIGTDSSLASQVVELLEGEVLLGGRTLGHRLGLTHWFRY